MVVWCAPGLRWRLGRSRAFSPEWRWQDDDAPDDPGEAHDVAGSGLREAAGLGPRWRQGTVDRTNDRRVHRVRYP